MIRTPILGSRRGEEENVKSEFGPHPIQNKKEEEKLKVVRNQKGSLPIGRTLLMLIPFWVVGSVSHLQEVSNHHSMKSIIIFWR